MQTEQSTENVYLGEVLAEQAQVERELKRRLDFSDIADPMRVVNVQMREQAEWGRRHKLEQEAVQRALAERNQTEMARKAAELALKELDLSAQRVEAEIELIRRQAGLDEARHEQERRRTLASLQLEEERSKAEAARGEREVALLKARRAVENDL